MPTLHAGTIEGERNEVGADANLIVYGPHGRMECSGVWIDDYQKGLDEIEVSVLGISDFQTLFGDHPHHLAYWRLA
ncbi:MAG: hypothetical protein M9944_03530 [Rhizobiaceae bacterium]|nr:hypothetical protein [Rhizobiaceae bacterium]